MDQKYNKGLNIKTITSLRKDKKSNAQKVENKERIKVPPLILIKF